jgi:hypothetical protein
VAGSPIKRARREAQVAAAERKRLDELMAEDRTSDVPSGPPPDLTHQGHVVRKQLDEAVTLAALPLGRAVGREAAVIMWIPLPLLKLSGLAELIRVLEHRRVVIDGGARARRRQGRVCDRLRVRHVRTARRDRPEHRGAGAGTRARCGDGAT